MDTSDLLPNNKFHSNFSGVLGFWGEDIRVAYSAETLKTRKAFKKLLDKFRPDTPFFIKEKFKSCTSCSSLSRGASFKSVIAFKYFRRNF